MGKTSTHLRSLHVFGALSRGGAETWFLQALASRGDNPWSADVCLLADREGACAPRARELGARVLHCPYRPAATFPARFLKLLRSERYDAVHSHVLLFSGVICALARAAGTRVRAAHAHNASDGRSAAPARRLYRKLMRRLIAEHANLVLACSSEAAAAFDAPSSRILPYGIDLSRFGAPSPDLRTSLNIAESEWVLGAVGRLTKQKNHAFLIEAFAQALRLQPRMRLLIAGEGELAADLAHRIDRLHLADRVLLLGARDDVPALLTSVCDGFVMPSLHEGLPIALLEAQAAGLPCLISEEISNEAVVLSGHVERLPLEGPWSRRMAAMVHKRRVAPALAVERLRQAGFDVRHCWSRLTGLYDDLYAARGRAHAA